MWRRRGGKVRKHGWETTVCCFLQKALLWGVRMCAQNRKGGDFVLEHPPRAADWTVWGVQGIYVRRARPGVLQ